MIDQRSVTVTGSGKRDGCSMMRLRFEALFPAFDTNAVTDSRGAVRLKTRLRHICRHARSCNGAKYAHLLFKSILNLIAPVIARRFLPKQSPATRPQTQFCWEQQAGDCRAANHAARNDSTGNCRSARVPVHAFAYYGAMPHALCPMQHNFVQFSI